jgi:MFS family permease
MEGSTQIEKEMIVEEEQSTKEENKNDINGVPKKQRGFIFSIAALSNSAGFISRVFIGLYAVLIGSTGAAIALITSIRNLIQTAFQSAFGRISDRIGRKNLMFIGLLTAGISVALFPLIKNGWVLVGGVVVFSLGFACYTPSFTALQGD